MGQREELKALKRVALMKRNDEEAMERRRKADLIKAWRFGAFKRKKYRQSTPVGRSRIQGY